MKSYVFVPNARSEEYRKKLEIIEKLEIDPFSRENISDARFDPKEILYESKHWFVFENQHAYPDTKHQLVFVSQKYAEDFTQLPVGAITDLYALMQQVCSEYGITGGGIVMRFGDPEKSGATVRHLHTQLIVPHDSKKTSAWFGCDQ